MKEIDDILLLNKEYFLYQEDKFFDVKENKYFTGLVYSKDNEGNIIGIAPYRNGILSGTKKMFYPNGKIKQEIEIVDNVRNGFFKVYEESGEETVSVLFEKGHLKKAIVNGEVVNAEMNGENLIIKR